MTVRHRSVRSPIRGTIFRPMPLNHFSTELLLGAVSCMAPPKIQNDPTASRQIVETGPRDPTVQVTDTDVSSASFTSAPITGGMHPADATRLHAATDATKQNSLVGLLRAYLRAHYCQLLDKVFSVSDDRLFISDRLLGTIPGGAPGQAWQGMRAGYAPA